jgi:hypothetical protein
VSDVRRGGHDARPAVALIEDAVFRWGINNCRKPPHDAYRGCNVLAHNPSGEADPGQLVRLDIKIGLPPDVRRLRRRRSLKGSASQAIPTSAWTPTQLMTTASGARATAQSSSRDRSPCARPIPSIWTAAAPPGLGASSSRFPAILLRIEQDAESIAWLVAGSASTGSSGIYSTKSRRTRIRHGWSSTTGKRSRGILCGSASRRARAPSSGALRERGGIPAAPLISTRRGRRLTS